MATSELAGSRSDDDRAETSVVIVVLDGVRWQDVFGGADRAVAGRRLTRPEWANPRGLMPNLYGYLDGRAIALGAAGHGPEMVASGPHYISLPGYLEIFTGRADSGCDRNDWWRPAPRTVADDVIEGSRREDVAVITSWPNIARAASADPSRFVVSAGRSVVESRAVLRSDAATAALLDEGAQAGPWPGEGDYRPDARTARVALRVLETARPRFLFVGLGDADEYAHRGDYAGYLDAVHASDAFLGQLVASLDRMGSRGRHTTVLLTTDHGRSRGFTDHGRRYPESGRVWLAAIGGHLTTHGLVTASERYTLSSIAPTVRALLGLPVESGRPIREILGGS